MALISNIYMRKGYLLRRKECKGVQGLEEIRDGLKQSLWRSKGAN